MNLELLLKVLLILDAVLLVATVVLVAVKFSKKAYKKEQCECCDCACADAVEEAPAEETPVVEEVVEEPAPVEAPVEEVAEPVVINDADADLDEDIRRIPFAEKMVFMEKDKQAFFDAINNEFLTYRKVNARISNKGVSYRFGRDLIAKITVRGKTMKVHYALDVNAFNQNIYFQKDMSDVKAYQEVPFTVKVRSERAAKNALKLIEALASVHGIQKKTRSTPVDSIEVLKAWVKEK
jgi:predicted transport protein